MTIEDTMFAMSKEFGWTPDYIYSMPFKWFNIYAEKLNIYYEAKAAALDGKSAPVPKFTEAEKLRKRKLLEKWKQNDKKGEAKRA